MEDYIQFSAKTKNEAITKACIELGVSSDQLDIQVISEGSSGFFGIGSKPAVIKVRKLQTVSDEDELKEIVDTVKVETIKEEEFKKPAQKTVQKPIQKPVQKNTPKPAATEETSKEDKRGSAETCKRKAKQRTSCKGKTCKGKTAKRKRSSERETCKGIQTCRNHYRCRGNQRD